MLGRSRTWKHEDIEKFIDKSSNELDGNVDILINNAGINQDNLSIRMDIEEWFIDHWTFH